MSEYVDEFTDVLAAYALDAVDPEERSRIEDHLRDCRWCSAEVAAHREVAALLATPGSAAPPGVWDRIAAELSPPAPPLRLSVSPTGDDDEPVDVEAGGDGGGDDGADVVPLTARRSVGLRTFTAALAAAACLLVVLGVVALDQRDQAREARQEAAAGPEATVPPPGPSDIRVSLSGADPRAGAQAVVTASGQGFLVSHDLPELDEAELFQLWGVVDGTVLSLGTFDHDAELVNFQLDPKRLDGVTAFAITREQVPGVVASEQEPVLQGTA